MLYAHSRSIPQEFNTGVLYVGQDRLYRGQQATISPHSLEALDDLKPENKFLANEPWEAIPPTEHSPGDCFTWVRCQLCQWTYGRLVKAIPCNHTICGVCLGKYTKALKPNQTNNTNITAGLTSLVTVNRYVCLVCFEVPDRIYTSWMVKDGERRLYWPGQEVVQKKSLYGHYRER